MIVKELSKQLDGKTYFKCPGYDHLQDDCPNRRALTLKEIEEIHQFALEVAEGKAVEEEEAMVLTQNARELLVI